MFRRRVSATRRIRRYSYLALVNQLLLFFFFRHLLISRHHGAAAAAQRDDVEDDFDIFNLSDELMFGARTYISAER